MLSIVVLLLPNVPAAGATHKRCRRGGSINTEAIEWLENLGELKRMTLFRPLGGSCANPNKGGATVFASIYADHNPHHPVGSDCRDCDHADELIIVE